MLVTTRERQAELAGLNLRAGEKAKDANAYEAALGHFVAGLDLARDVGDAQLGHQLGVRHIEAMYLCGRFEEAERLAEALLRVPSCRSTNSRARAARAGAHHAAQIPQGTRHRRARARAPGRAHPGAPGTMHVMAELARTELALAGRSIHKLRALPRMTDPRKVVAMRILMLSTAPAYFEDQNLLPLVSLRMVRLSVRYGNAAHSAYGYAMYGLVLCGVLNDMRRGLAFGRLALDAIDCSMHASSSAECRWCSVASFCTGTAG